MQQEDRIGHAVKHGSEIVLFRLEVVDTDPHLLAEIGQSRGEHRQISRLSGYLGGEVAVGHRLGSM